MSREVCGHAPADATEYPRPAAPASAAPPAPPPAAPAPAVPAAGSTARAGGSTSPATGSTSPATGSTSPATGSTSPATGSTSPGSPTRAAGVALPAGRDAPAGDGTSSTDGHEVAPGTAAGRRGPRRVTTLLGAALAGGGLLGWLAAGSWQATQAEAILTTRQQTVAVVLGAFSTDQEVQRVRADLTVRVTNAGAAPVEVGEAGESFDAGTILGADGLPRTVPAGGTALLTLRTSALCLSPQPLRLPPLTFRGPDGVSRDLPVQGDTEALADVCSRTFPLLTVVTSAVQDDGRLRLAVRGPAGRSTRVDRIRAGGVLLPAAPLPADVRGRGRIITLRPPDGCDRTWRAGGLPTVLDVDVDVGGPAVLRVPVGPVLARWLLASGCRESP